MVLILFVEKLKCRTNVRYDDSATGETFVQVDPQTTSQTDTGLKLELHGARAVIFLDAPTHLYKRVCPSVGP